MVLKIKIIKSNKNGWAGMFGNDLIKIKLKLNNFDNAESVEKQLTLFLEKELGVTKDKFKIKKIKNDLYSFEIKDIAWEIIISLM